MYPALFKSLYVVCSYLSFSENTISIRDALMTLGIDFFLLVFEVPCELIMLKYMPTILANK